MKAIAALALLLGLGLAAQADHYPAVPDLTLTPGVARTDVSRAGICATAWGKDARHVTDKMKRDVFDRYAIKCNPDCGKLFEVDHLISRELGGADDVRNLWPQSYGSHPWNARLKDKLENRLHREMCAGRITLKQAQGALVNDWRVAYRRYYGEP